MLDESHVGEHKGLKKISGEKSVIVQFFGTHDFARYVKFRILIIFRLLYTDEAWDSFWSIMIRLDGNTDRHLRS